MFGHHHNKFNSIFNVESKFEPAVVEQVQDEDGEVYDQLKIEKKTKSKPKYLPGQKLLRHLNKANQKKKEKELDMNQLESSIANVLRLF